MNIFRKFLSWIKSIARVNQVTKPASDFVREVKKVKLKKTFEQVVEENEYTSGEVYGSSIARGFFGTLRRTNTRLEDIIERVKGPSSLISGDVKGRQIIQALESRYASNPRELFYKPGSAAFDSDYFKHNVETVIKEILFKADVDVTDNKEKVSNKFKEMVKYREQ